VSNAKRTLEISQPWPSPDTAPDTLSDCVRYVRDCKATDHFYRYAASRCADAAAVMYIRHPEYFT
jgi:hypothetical protein